MQWGADPAGYLIINYLINLLLKIAEGLQVNVSHVAAYIT